MTSSGLQSVGLRAKLGRLRLTKTGAMRRGMPWKIWGRGSETAVTWAVSGLTLKARAEDDVAEVIATGNGGDDEDEGERGALVGAGEVDLAGEVEGVGAGAGAGGEFAEEAGGGAAGIGLLGEAGVGFEGGGFDRCLRAVGDALKGGGEAGWGGEVEDAEVLFAVFAGEVEGEGGVGGSGGIGDAGGEAGVEGAGAVGTGFSSTLKNWREVWGARTESQGVKTLWTS